MEDPQFYVLAGIRPQIELYTKPTPDLLTVPEELQRTAEWQGLVQLFEWCTTSNPEERPTATQLLQALTQIEEKKELKLKGGVANHSFKLTIFSVTYSQLKQIQEKKEEIRLVEKGINNSVQ